MEAAFNETTPAYDATKSDVWSCGVLLCLMLMHHFPYDFDEMVSCAASRGQRKQVAHT
jgi:hypothetical protein